MRNRNIIVSVAVGVAALTAAGILMSKRKNRGSANDGEQQLSETFRHKLQQLQRKAQREFKSADGSDVENIAKERANQWVSKTSANL